MIKPFTFALGAVLALASTPAAAGPLTITVTDLRNSDGVVRACITALEDAFPRCNRVAHAFDSRRSLAIRLKAD